MDNAEWLAGLNVGDEVAVYHGRYTPQIAKISRVTKTQIVVVDGTRYDRAYGVEITSLNWHGYLREITAEVKVRLLRESLAVYIRNDGIRRLEKLSTEDLQAIADILRKYEEKEASDDRRDD